jgi:predicted solute-binding protein
MRLGMIRYLNALPFHYGIAPDVNLIQDAPAALAVRMAAGEFDASLVPAAAFIKEGRELGWSRVANLGIASAGSVGSVYIRATVPPAEIRSLRLCAESRTSNLLAQMILRRRYHTAPRVIPSGADTLPADGEVIIGDVALGHAPAAGESLIDLGREWLLLTGLPVVFAVVVGQDAAAARAADALLAPVVARNLDQLDTMLTALNLMRHRDYFSRLHYRLEAGHQEALRAFAAMLEEECI